MISTGWGYQQHGHQASRVFLYPWYSLMMSYATLKLGSSITHGTLVETSSNTLRLCSELVVGIELGTTWQESPTLIIPNMIQITKDYQTIRF